MANDCAHSEHFYRLMASLCSIPPPTPVLVMDNGRAAEIGTPAELIDNNGIFTELVNATGEGAIALIAMARQRKQRSKENDRK